MNVPEERLFVTPNGVDTRAFTYTEYPKYFHFKNNGNKDLLKD